MCGCELKALAQKGPMAARFLKKLFGGANVV